jgi:hypothetical protein
MAGKHSPINVGILGLGRSGRGIHVDAITHLPEMFKLVAVTDQLPGRASESAASTKARLHQSFEQLLADREVELVIEVELTDFFAYPQDRWFVCGTAGGLRGSASGLEWKWVDWSQMRPRPLELQSTPDRSCNSESLKWHSASWHPAGSADAGAGAAPARQPVIDLYTSLFQTIRLGEPQKITPESTRRRVAVMEKARQCGGFY